MTWGGVGGGGVRVPRKKKKRGGVTRFSPEFP